MAAPYDKKHIEKMKLIGQYYEELVEAYDWENPNTPDVKMPAIRAFVETKIPFLAECMQRVDIRFVEKKDTPSMAWTDGFRVYISVAHYEMYGQAVTKAGLKWFSSINLGMVFLVCHEFGHLILKSFDRMHERDPRLWNTSTDEKINQMMAQAMKEAGMFRSAKAYENFLEVLSTLFVYDSSKYGSHTAEEVYGDLHEIKVCLGGEGGGDGANGGDMVGNGKPEKDENGNDLSNEEKMARDIVSDSFKDYMQRNANKMPGQGTCGREMAYVTEPPPVRMSDVLKKIPKQVFKQDWGYGRRPNRADPMIPVGVSGQRYHLPTLVDTHPDKIQAACFCLDFSGSMTPKQCNMTLNLIKAAQSHIGKIYVIIFTSEVCWHGWIDDATDVPTNYSGGTAFGPVVELLRELEEVGIKGKKFHFNCIVACTDLFLEREFIPSDFYRDQPKRLRWIIFGNPNAQPLTAPNHVWYVDEIS